MIAPSFPPPQFKNKHMLEASMQEKLARCLCCKAQTSSKAPSKLLPKSPQILPGNSPSTSKSCPRDKRAREAGAWLHGPRSTQETFRKHQ